MTAPTRECGTCAACCKVFSIPELQKPARTWCPHARPGTTTPCSIYATRPATCANFLCGWRHGWLRDEDRPDRVRVMVSAQETTDQLRMALVGYGTPHPGYLISVWELAPGAARDRPSVRQFVEQMTDDGYAVVVIRPDGSRTLHTLRRVDALTVPDAVDLSIDDIRAATVAPNLFDRSSR